jgi:hypothetical protein
VKALQITEVRLLAKGALAGTLAHSNVGRRATGGGRGGWEEGSPVFLGPSCSGGTAGCSGSKGPGGLIGAGVGKRGSEGIRGPGPWPSPSVSGSPHAVLQARVLVPAQESLYLAGMVPPHPAAQLWLLPRPWSLLMGSAGWQGSPPSPLVLSSRPPPNT